MDWLRLNVKQHYEDLRRQNKVSLWDFAALTLDGRPYHEEVENAQHIHVVP